MRPPVVERISARDLNITAQTLTLSDAERFDLIIGTNVFLYYDRLQQGLAMASVARMLRPGGLLLSNNALVEVPSTGMRSVGYSRTLYSEQGRGRRSHHLVSESDEVAAFVAYSAASRSYNARGR